MQPSKQAFPLRLNPMAFPAETDMRFLLLLIAAAGTITGLGEFAIYALAQFLPVEDAIARRMSIGGAFLITVLMFILAHRRATQAASKLISEERWSPFPPLRGNPSEQASLKRMSEHVDRLVAQLPNVAGQQPRFFWNDTSTDSQAPVGMAFGYRHKQYVCLHEGLHAAFLSTPGVARFHAVLLHELGHIANRDVTRTTFSIELGRTFTQVAVGLAAITDGYLLFHLIQRLLRRQTDQTYIESSRIVVEVAIGTLVVILLIEIIRASILRAREYYADAAACQWLGSETTLLKLFERRNVRAAAPSIMPSQAAMGIVQQRWLPPKGLVRKLFRRYVAALHPPLARRIESLTDPCALFRVDLGTAWIAGVLSGLALSTHRLVLSLPLQFGSSATAWLWNSFNLEMSDAVLLAMYVLSVVLTILMYALVVTVFVAFFLAPLIGTVGVMVQRAVFADYVNFPEKVLLPLRRLAILALVIGIGIVLGGTLTPVPGALTLRNRGWLLAPLYVLVWASVVFVWLLPLRWFAAYAYRSHVGAKPPTFRRRCLAVLAASAIVPLFIVTTFGQAVTTTAGVAPIAPEVVSFVLGGALISPPLSFSIWGVGALMMWLAGWFEPPRCPACGKTAKFSKAIALCCTHCGKALLTWAVAPAPVQIPALPPLSSPPPVDAPPPL